MNQGTAADPPGLTTSERRGEPGASPVLLSARGLTKAYGKSLAVRGVDFDVPERAFTTLLGPSGCGKTTILRMIAGFEGVTAGSLTLDGEPLAAVPPERRPVNTVFQSYALFPHLTVEENVCFSMMLKRVPRETALRRAARALESVHMAEFTDRYPSELSGGQQQRVAVARAIVAEPRLLLLDEPLSALDRKMRAHLQLELKDLQRRLGIAFVYVTHDQEEAFALSDLVIVMNEGRIEQRGAPEEIYAKPANDFVADFIGGATLVPGVVREARGVQAGIDVPFGRVTARCVDGLRRDDRAFLCVRPEQVSLDRKGPVQGVVSHVVFQGGRSLVEVTAGDLLWRLWSDTPPAVGSRAGLALDGDKIWITAARGAVA